MNATGHMLVAKIAWDVMTPAARAAVTKLASNPNNPQSGTPTQPFDGDPLTAACYMDDIRPTFGSLHFDDTHIDAKGKPLPTQHADQNAVTFCTDQMAILRNPKASADQKAEAMRYTMHLTADLHQPLHCVSRVTSQNPDGDRGGNLFPIRWSNTASETVCCCDACTHPATESGPSTEGGGPLGSNLHSYWDSAAGTFVRLNRPLSSGDSKTLENMAFAIEKKYPMQVFGTTVGNSDPKAWQAEGVVLAGKDAYKGISPNAEPSAKYRQVVIDDMERETALAGYRLGTFLNEVFK